MSLASDIQLVIDALTKGEGTDDSGQCIFVLNDIKFRLAALDWIPCARELPDDETTILIANVNWSDPVTQGYRVGGEWFEIGGAVLDGCHFSGSPDANFDPPTHWMHVPEFNEGEEVAS